VSQDSISGGKLHPYEWSKSSQNHQLSQSQMRYCFS
jgi:hypothetical protein